MSLSDGLPSDDWRIVNSDVADDGIVVITDESERDSTYEDEPPKEKTSSRDVSLATDDEWADYFGTVAEYLTSRSWLVPLVTASTLIALLAIAASQWPRPLNTADPGPDVGKVSSSLLTLQKLEQALVGLDKTVQQMNERLVVLSDDVKILKESIQNADSRERNSNAEKVEEAVDRGTIHHNSAQKSLMSLKETIRSVQKQIYLQIVTSSYEHKLLLYRRLLSSGPALEELSRGDFLLVRNLRNLILKSTTTDFESWLNFHSNVVSPQMQEAVRKIDSLTGDPVEGDDGNSDEFFVRANSGEPDLKSGDFVTPHWKDVDSEWKPRLVRRYENERRSQQTETNTRQPNSEPNKAHTKPKRVNSYSILPNNGNQAHRNPKFDEKRPKRKGFLDKMSKIAHKTVAGVKSTVRDGLTKMKKWTKCSKSKEPEKQSYASWRNEFVTELMDLVRTVGRNPTLTTVSSYLGEGLEKLTSPSESQEY